MFWHAFHGSVLDATRWPRSVGDSRPSYWRNWWDIPGKRPLKMCTHIWLFHQWFPADFPSVRYFFCIYLKEIKNYKLKIKYFHKTIFQKAWFKSNYMPKWFAGDVINSFRNFITVKTCLKNLEFFEFCIICLPLYKDFWDSTENCQKALVKWSVTCHL